MEGGRRPPSSDLGGDEWGQPSHPTVRGLSLRGYGFTLWHTADAFPEPSACGSMGRMTEDWPVDRVYADLQKRSGPASVKLTTIGSREDLARLGLTLTDGLRLRLYSDDADSSGRPDPFLFEGTARWDAEADCWVADVDEGSIRHASDQV
jgi:hypothetical protein